MVLLCRKCIFSTHCIAYRQKQKNLSKKRQEHTIEHQIINLEINGVQSDSEIKEIQQAVAYYFKSRLGEELDKKLSALVPHDVHITLDNLTLDLKEVSFNNLMDLEKKLYAQVKVAVEKEVRKKMRQVQRNASTKTSVKKASKIAIFEHFIRYGFYPSWADDKNGSIQEIFAELLRKRTSGLDKVIMRVKDISAARERLYQQFKKEDLEQLANLLYGAKASKMLVQLDIIKKRLGKNAEKAIIGAAIDYILQVGNVTTMNNRSFARAIIENVQTRKVDVATTSKVRASYADSYTDLEILKYFLEYGAIPFWADVDSKKSFKELFNTLTNTRLSSVQRLIEKQANNSAFIKRLIYQFDTEDVLQLLEPTPGENLVFIKDSINDFDFLSQDRSQINSRISRSKIREVVLMAALDYFFVRGKSRFVKQSFVKQLLEDFAELSATPIDTLTRESYKAVRQKKADTAVRSALETLDLNLRKQLNEDKQALRSTQRDYRDIDRKIQQIEQKLNRTGLSDQEIQQLTKEQNGLQKKLTKLEKNIIDLGGDDMPLEIELVLQQRQLLQAQIQRTILEEERQKIEKRLANSDKEFQKLQTGLSRDLTKMFDDKTKLQENNTTASQKRIQRIDNRLKKYQRAVSNVVDKIQQDEKNLILFLENIRVAFRQASTEEKRKLRQERERIEKEVKTLRTYLEQLDTQAVQLNEAIEQAAAPMINTEEKALNTRTSKLDYLIFLLKYGSTPWWAEDFKQQTIEDLFLEFANNDAIKLKRAFATVGKYPVVWQRVVNQLSESAIRTVISKTYTNAARVIFDQAEILATIHYSQVFDNLRTANAKEFKWLAILEYLLIGGDTFQQQKFVREMTVQTARNYGISAGRLLEFTHNIADNNDNKDYTKITLQLAKDEEIAQVDREMIARARKERMRQEGLDLTNSQKLAILIDFLETGRISDVAKSYKYNTVGDFKNLFYEQIQKNNSEVRRTISSLLQLSNTRSVLINIFPEEVFWEAVNLVKPSATLPAKRYFSDMKKALDNDDLILEKDLLLSYFLGHQGKFEVLEYLRALVSILHQNTGREIVAILEDWKRKSKNIAANSSFLLSVYALELEAIKEDQAKQEDMNLRINLQTRIEQLTQEYTDQSRLLLDILTEEMAENQGIAEKKYKLSEITAATKRLTTQINDLQQQLGNKKGLEEITLKRQLISLQAEIRLLALQVPPTVRLLNEQIETAKKRLAEANAQLEQQQKEVRKVEALQEEKEAVEEALVAQQIELYQLLQQQAPTGLDLLPKVLARMQDSDQTHHAFVKELEQLAANIDDVDYSSAVLLGLGEYATDIPTIARLQNQAGQTTDLDKRQQALLSKINRASPFELWQDWDNLQGFYANNPSLKTPEKDRLQQQIFRQIKRKHQANLLTLTATLLQVQQQAQQAIAKADTIADLEAAQQQIDNLRTQQNNQLGDLIAAAREPDIRKDFEQLQAQMEQQLVTLQNKRIRQTNQLIAEQQEEVAARKDRTAIELEELERERDFVIDEIQEVEEPKAEEPIVKKPKRKKRVEAPPPPKIEEPLRLYNAGLVLLWPYFSRLFGVFKLTQGKNFVSEEAQFKAVHLLQYIATGKTEAPENELVLNKIICNLPLTTPVPLSVEFTEEELKMADGLLIGAAGNWPKMKTMQPPAFRASFLMREGTLVEEEDKWLIQINKKAFDVLLKSLPWGFNFIKLPWLEKFISVEWPLI